MKRIVLASALAASVLAATIPAHSAPLTPTFNVNIGLTTGCVIATAPGAVSFTYSFNQGSAQGLDSNGSIGVRCSKNLDYSLTLDGTGSYVDDATDLSYTLSLSAANATGNGVAQSYTITGSMAANQSGTCASSLASCTNAAATNKTRTITVSY